MCDPQPSTLGRFNYSGGKFGVFILELEIAAVRKIGTVYLS